MNTAILTGHTQSWSLRIYSLSQAGHVTDITSQTTCHSGQEIVLKVRTSGFLSTRVHYEQVITTRKRSLGQGNVFTHVCYSVHRGRGSLYDVTSCLVAWSHVPSGVSVSGPMFLPGDLCPEGTLSEGSVRGLCSGSLVRETTQTETPHMGKSGRYTSYWNAFLLSFLNWGTTF